MSVQYLDPEIANEGVKVTDPISGIVTDGSDDPRSENWQPRMKPPNIPSYEGIKSIEKYFPEFTGIPYRYQPYPAYLYHETLPRKFVRNALEAKKLGVENRESTHEERNNGFGPRRWVYTGDWRAFPVKEEAFDPDHPGAGKVVVHGGSSQQAPMSNASVQTMAAAMASAMAAEMAKQSNKPVSADPDYNEFLEFKAWKAANKQEIDEIKEVVTSSFPPSNVGTAANVLETLPPTKLTAKEERDVLVGLANEKGIRIDNRWGVDRVKAALEQAGE